MNYKYLIDTNVITDSKIRKAIDTNFFKDNCIVIEEVAYELQDTKLADAAQRIALSVDEKTLPYLATVVDEMVELGILKVDEGNGEAILIAHGLLMKDTSSDPQVSFEFMRENPVIVTNERKVAAYVKSKGLNAMNQDAFCDMLLKIGVISR